MWSGLSSTYKHIYLVTKTGTLGKTKDTEEASDDIFLHLNNFMFLCNNQK